MSDATDHHPGLPSTVVMMTDNEGGPDRRGRTLVCDEFVSLGDSVAWDSVAYTTCFFSSRLRRSDSEIFSLSKLLLLRRAPLEVVVFLRNKKTA